MSVVGRDRPVMHQFLAAATPHDAVTNQALALQEILAAGGLRTGIVAEHVDAALAGRVQRLQARRMPRVPILLRYSIWSAAAEAALEHTHRLGLVYHNITPPELLGRANPAVAALCSRGRRALPRIVARSSLWVADSVFNATDLREAGAPRVRVIPLILDLPRLAIPPAAPSHDVLFVGRIAPSKRIEDLIDAVALLRRHHLPTARLRVIGDWSAFPGYRRSVGEHARRNGLADAVIFTGSVTDAERDRAMTASGAYLTMSEHEGFCVPLLEAMAHGLPVVARDAGAVRETAGGAALILRDRNPRVAAAALSAVLSNPTVRIGLAANAERRLDEINPQRVGAQLQRVVEELTA